MSEENLRNYEAPETDPRTRNARLRRGNGFVVAAKHGDSAAFEAFQTVRKHGPPYRAANDADQRGWRRCNAGIVSAGLYSSEEF